MALVGCAILALALPRAAYASGNGGGDSGGSGGSGQSEKTESSQSGGGGGDDGDDGDDGGDDSGGNSGSGSGSGSGSQSSGQSSGSSGISGSGKVVNQDEVLSAVRAGKAVSLPLLLAFMANKFPGEIVDIKLKNKEGLYSYEVEYLANSSKLRVLKLNAKTLSKL
jgi:hypothetical protein